MAIYFNFFNQCIKANGDIEAPIINLNDNIYFEQDKKVRYIVYCTASIISVPQKKAEISVLRYTRQIC